MNPYLQPKLVTLAKTVELTLKRPFIQFEVQVFDLSTDVYLSNSANEIHQHLHLNKTEAVSHRSPINTYKT